MAPVCMGFEEHSLRRRLVADLRSFPQPRRSGQGRSELSNSLVWVAVEESEVSYQGRGIWVIIKMMVPFWVLAIIRHLVFRGPKRDHDFDNHPYTKYQVTRST